MLPFPRDDFKVTLRFDQPITVRAEKWVRLICTPVKYENAPSAYDALSV